MNALTKHEAAALPALAMDQSELMAVLRTSLYPGAQDESIKMALGYCKAAGLDPMQKPVHIVPMWDRSTKSMRDVIMPGIGLYRTQAARSGALAGISEPEFGPDVSMRIGEMEFAYPDWCRVTVTRRMADGALATFTSREYWIENYATAGKDSSAPNSMWRKRPRGQIAKCAQAQALRMAFPEMTGSQPTAEEMENAADETPVPPVQPRQTPLAERVDTYPDDQFKNNLPAWEKVITSGRKTPEQIITMAQSKHPLTDAQKKSVMALGKTDQPQSAEQSSGLVVTFAQVADKLNQAADKQQLDDAGGLIGEVADPKQRTELSAIYDRRVAELDAD